ncbi:hypothetical protein BM525_20130 (plasmid) [Alteromonas mediterranea]|uniref:OmpA-like domain-containing protein n=2 Tax=Alteromonas mediterranea TaxID=314275 RepID=A0AAC9NU62_9ALTE|nr:hypothetical protein BM524_19935 [Alteromonas mediterranea]APE00047.1 hypothetical protein BM525_20130 [Alteromonas mediterranea]
MNVIGMQGFIFFLVQKKYFNEVVFLKAQRGKDAMKTLITTLTVIASLSMSGNTLADSVQANRMQLRLAPSVSGCTFDRPVMQMYRTGPSQVSGSLTVNCKPGAMPYRLTTTLSPFANITINDGRVYAVKMHIHPERLDCETIPLHSGSRGASSVGDGERTRWQVCASLKPIKNATYFSMQDAWPLHGDFDITLTDAKEKTVPSEASLMHVYFAHNSSVLSAEAKKLMDNIIGSVDDISRFHVQLHAHTSLIGSAEYNHSLSLMRLKRVREYLIEKHNVRLSDTWGQAWGENRPKAIKTIKDEATENRRVDLVFIPKKISSMTPTKNVRSDDGVNVNVDVGVAERPITSRYSGDI